MLGKDSVLSDRASWSVLAIIVLCVSYLHYRMNNIDVYAVFRGRGDDGSLYDSLLDSLDRVQ